MPVGSSTEKYTILKNGRDTFIFSYGQDISADAIDNAVLLLVAMGAAFAQICFLRLTRFWMHFELRPCLCFRGGGGVWRCSRSMLARAYYNYREISTLTTTTTLPDS